MTDSLHDSLLLTKLNRPRLPNDLLQRSRLGEWLNHDIDHPLILVMCRSGGRSAMAVNALAKAGFTKVHNIIDGFEGDKVEDPESVYHGMRVRNGWKNSVPWTYKLDPKLVWLPSDVELETLRGTLDL